MGNLVKRLSLSIKFMSNEQKGVVCGPRKRNLYIYKAGMACVQISLSANGRGEMTYLNLIMGKL